MPKNVTKDGQEEQDLNAAKPEWRSVHRWTVGAGVPIKRQKKMVQGSNKIRWL